MQTHDESFYEDERDWQAQQQADDELKQLRLTEILRRLAEGVPVTKDDVAMLCAGCGIDKRNVL